MQALKVRSSSRSFSSKPLPAQVLSDLLWAGFGINRPDSGRRTAPSARNWQEVSVYVATAEGMFLYDAKEHVLVPVLSEDVRGMAGMQPFVKDAPLNLVFVADHTKMEGTDEQKTAYAAADSAFIAENVYLFCASEGLATVVRASIDKPALAAKLNLPDTQHITFGQTVGYPAE
jgi:nitroreductase